MLRDLAVPGVPRVLELLVHEGGPVMVWQDQGFRPLRNMPAMLMPDLEVFFDAAVRTCSILSELHLRGITNGSLHPSGIWVTGDGRDVQLADFSRALRQGRAAARHRRSCSS